MNDASVKIVKKRHPNPNLTPNHKKDLKRFQFTSTEARDDPAANGASFPHVVKLALDGDKRGIQEYDVGDVKRVYKQIKVSNRVYHGGARRRL